MAAPCTPVRLPTARGPCLNLQAPIDQQHGASSKPELMTAPFAVAEKFTRPRGLLASQNALDVVFSCLPRTAELYAACLSNTAINRCAGGRWESGGCWASRRAILGGGEVGLAGVCC